MRSMLTLVHALQNSIFVRINFDMAPIESGSDTWKRFRWYLGVQTCKVRGVQTEKFPWKDKQWVSLTNKLGYWWGKRTKLVIPELGKCLWLLTHKLRPHENNSRLCLAPPHQHISLYANKNSTGIQALAFRKSRRHSGQPWCVRSQLTMHSVWNRWVHSELTDWATSSPFSNDDKQMEQSVWFESSSSV